MQATIGAALCKEVIDSFLETSHKEYGFYGRLEGMARNCDAGLADHKDELATMREMVDKLKRSFAMPFSFQERAEMAVETSHAERAIKT